MKKILVAAIIAIAVTSTAFGATSNDVREGVYLRQDVFEAKMDAFMAEIRLMNQQVRTDMKQDIQTVKEELHKEIQDTKAELQKDIRANSTAIQQVRTELKQDIQTVKEELQKDIQANSTAIQQVRTELKQDIQATNARIDVTNARLDELKTMVYWGIALLGLLTTFGAVAPSIVQVIKELSAQKFSLEDVERLIDAKLQSRNA